jgi:4-hydroxy-4-methyl-2-oxoglutarate aldolase
MNENVIYRRVRRPDAALVARAAACAMSDLYEALEPAPRSAALMSPRMRPVVSGVRIAGPAVTVRCSSGDNLMMHKALLLAEPGDVLVIEAGTPSGAQWGLLAAVYAQRKGLAGVVVHGCIRDVDYLIEQRCPVWCTEISPSHPEKRGAGSVNAPIDCDGVRVYPGDVISADGDGVLVIPRGNLLSAVEKAERRGEREQKDIAEITAGRSLFEIHDLQAALEASGVVEIDEEWSGKGRR